MRICVLLLTLFLWGVVSFTKISLKSKFIPIKHASSRLKMETKFDGIDVIPANILDIIQILPMCTTEFCTESSSFQEVFSLSLTVLGLFMPKLFFPAVYGHKVISLKTRAGEMIGFVDLSLQTSSGSLDALKPSSISERRQRYSDLQPYLCNLLVKPEYRKRGLAKRLIGACLQESASWGKTQICLHVQANSVPALSLYLSLGFDVISDGDSPNGRVLFLKKIQGANEIGRC